MRQVERDQRRETIAPVGDVIKGFGVGDRIGIEHRQFGADSAGIGERQTDLEAAARRDVIEGINLQRVVLLGDDNAGYFSLHLSRKRGRKRSIRVVKSIFSLRDVLSRKLPFDAVDGQARQPQAENAPPVR